MTKSCGVPQDSWPAALHVRQGGAELRVCGLMTQVRLVKFASAAGREARAAGPAYAGEVDDGYVCADELGAPMHPERYSDEFARLFREAQLLKIRLHDTRATMNSILELLGVPISLRAAWMGHTPEVNQDSYLARPGDLTPVSDAVGALFGAVPS